MRIFILAFLLGFAISTYGVETYKDAWDNLTHNTMRMDTGTGFIVIGKSGKKYFATAWHVCEGEWDFRSDVIADPDHDICAIPYEGPKKGLKVAKRYSTHEPIFSRGYPRLGSDRHLTHTEGFWYGVTDYESDYSSPKEKGCNKGGKIVFEFGSEVRCERKWIQNLTTLFVRPGSSGSPVVNSEGQLIGIVSTYDMRSPIFKKEGAGIVRHMDVKAFFDKL